MRIDSALLEKCSDPQGPEAWRGKGWIEYAKYLDGQYDLCQARHKGLSEAAKAATE